MSKRHGWIGVKSSISHNETSFGNMPNPLPAVVVVVGCCHRCHSEQTTCWRENWYFITLWVVKLVEAVCSLQNVATGGGTWRMHFGCPGSDQPLFFVYVYIYIYTIAKICASNNWCLKHQSIARISSATTATRTTTMINKDTQHVKQHTSKLKQTLRWFNLSDLFLDLSKPVGPARYFLGRLAATNPRQQNTTNIYEYLPEYLWTSEFESEIFRTSNLRWPFELSIEHPYLLGWHWVCNPLRSCWKGWLVHHPITLHRPELSGASQHHLESSGPL